MGGWVLCYYGLGRHWHSFQIFNPSLWTTWCLKSFGLGPNITILTVFKHTLENTKKISEKKYSLSITGIAFLKIKLYDCHHFLPKSNFPSAVFWASAWHRAKHLPSEWFCLLSCTKMSGSLLSWGYYDELCCLCLMRPPGLPQPRLGTFTRPAHPPGGSSGDREDCYMACTCPPSLSHTLKAQFAEQWGCCICSVDIIPPPPPQQLLTPHLWAVTVEGH